MDAKKRLSNLLQNFKTKDITFIKEVGNHWILCNEEDLKDKKTRGNVQVTAIKKRGGIHK